VLELYQFETCPYCVTVREKLSDLGLDYICRNAPPNRPDKDKVLLAISGDVKVPFLVHPDRGVYLSGTLAIVAWLEDTYGTGARKGAEVEPDVCRLPRRG
jgi:glutathione S-transferase